MADSIYTNFIEAKNSSLIPVLKSGRTLESRYNPQRDGENLANSLDKKFSFFLLMGIGSGILISKILEKFPESRILALEMTDAELSFLKTNQETAKILSDKRIILSTSDQLEKNLINYYIPAKFGDLKIIEQKNWLLENEDKLDFIKSQIKNALEIISSDFSVQSHFGKIWTCNILNNIKLLSKQNADYSLKAKEKLAAGKNIIGKNKKALVLGAGPSLDQKIEILKKNPENYFIISTDTAFQTLSKHKIKPDMVFSLDGQAISHNHFINSSDFSDILFAFDLSANFSAVKHVLDAGGKIIFFISGHPLSTLFNQFYKHYANALPELNSGSGTVTIAALDFAVKCGFKNIQVLGADFGYSRGKAYTRGTYLDVLYNKGANRLKTSEKLFDNLLFRTELEKVSDDKVTTKILSGYKTSFEDFLEKNHLNYKLEDEIYQIENPKNHENPKNTVAKDFIENIFKNHNFDYQNFNYQNFKDFFMQTEKKEPEVFEIALLPYISWLRKNADYKDLKFQDFQNLAKSFIVSYN